MGLDFRMIFSIGRLVITASASSFYAATLTAMVLGEEVEQMREYMVAGWKLRNAQPTAVAALATHDNGLDGMGS